jgi:hypothetical protein
MQSNFLSVKKVLAVLTLLLLLFIFILYATLRTKVNDVSDKKPYAEFMGKQLAIKRPAGISKTREPDVQANPYLLTDLQTEAREDAGPLFVLPAGSVISLQKAKLFRGGTSGFEVSYVLGTVFVPELNAEVAFEYAWGKNNWLPTSDHQDHYTFPLALWQDRVIEGKFSY